ncbi:hypothetical protein OG562_07700 [Streptomyces sp. NBC_01275]|uniref:hypothetical protein n=1 Tax=Streptomyces sp. NBC_01275 TaxID=2903807 RepID=UPI002253CD5F|nr:hypothetical protein [Streptomyces sp. NBC_01275]MCX4760852.1 hypothetical protein [Streptomyces sp. NBC_01275]
MSSPALAAALADIDTVFNGFASPNETGCGYCHAPEETAYLRTPYTRVPVDVVRYYLFEVADHFDDHAASMRRLLPQAARSMADGTLSAIGYSPHGWSRMGWRSWPAEQSAAIEAFLIAWWQDTLMTPEPPYGVDDVFETCATIAGTVTPFLDGWVQGPVADAHLARCTDVWLYDLLSDYSPFSFWYDDSEDAGIAALRDWLAGPGAVRLRAQGEPDLAARAELLPLSYDERWTHPYWGSASTAD